MARLAQRTVGRLVAAVVLFVTLVAGATPARAELTTTFNASVLLLNQPPTRPWAIKLRLGGSFVDSAGTDVQPILQQLTFHLPDGTVNTRGVRTCTGEPRVIVASIVDICPPHDAVAFGTSDVQLWRPPGIDRHGRPPSYDYHLRLTMYIGPRTARGRTLMVLGKGINSPLTAVMRGTLIRVPGPLAGWTYELPIPVIDDPEIGAMKVQRFAMDVGGFTRAEPRQWFVEAPRACPAGGFQLGMDARFEGLPLTVVTRRIDCELPGV